jgi:predicted transcriptional regulator
VDGPVLTGMASRDVAEWLTRFLQAGWIECRFLVGQGSNRAERITVLEEEDLLSFWAGDDIRRLRSKDRGSRGRGSRAAADTRRQLSMSPKKSLALTPSEWRLMRCVWDLRAADPPQVAEHLRSTFGDEVSPKTVGIFLARLEKKGYLRSSPRTAARGRPPHVYVPLVAYEDALRQQLEKFLEDHSIDEKGRGALEALLGWNRDHVKSSG